MYAVLIRTGETWRRAVISEFEWKQLEQLREHLNQRHAERIAPVVKNVSRSRISSNVRNEQPRGKPRGIKTKDKAKVYAPRGRELDPERFEFLHTLGQKQPRLRAF